MILVTGGTGLIGSHLITSLIKNGEQVKALYRSTIPSFYLSDRVEWVKGDILDIVGLQEALINVHKVYHCAAVVSFNPRKKDELHKINIEGTVNIVNASLDTGIEKLLFVSSVAALGRKKENDCIDEHIQWSETNSYSEYGKTKYLAEMEVWRGIGEGLNAVIINPVTVLGAGNWHKGSSELFKSAYNEFPWFTEGINGFTDVLDVVKAMIFLMNSNIQSERYIISTTNLAYRNLFTMMANCFGKKPPHKKVKPWMAEILWRLEGLKTKFSGKEPLLTKETVHTAQVKICFDNTKLLKAIPEFSYTPMEDTVNRICRELKERYNL